MPHSTADDAVMAEGTTAHQAMGGLLNMYGEYEGEADFDTTGKDADAVDYEDIDDDDDLPEEEPATNGLEEEDKDGDITQDFMRAVQAPHNTGDGDGDIPIEMGDGEHMNGDLFDEDEEDEDNDLFGDSLLLPDTHHHPKTSQDPAPQRLGGLALPSRSNLALPRPGASTPSSSAQQASRGRAMSTSLSPPAFKQQGHSILSPPDTDEDDDKDLNDEERRQRDMQRELFREAKKRHAGEDITIEDTQTDLDAFHQLFAGYEDYQTPRFIQLFPPREIQHRGKEPLKPPKAIVPAKLSLDILQDQERSFRTSTVSTRAGQDSTFNNSFIQLRPSGAADGDSDEDSSPSDFDEDTLIGNVSMQDLALICEDWDVSSIDTAPLHGDGRLVQDASGDWDVDEHHRPQKKQKFSSSASALPPAPVDPFVSFDNPERMAAKIAKHVTLDLNDPHLLINEHAPRSKKPMKRLQGDFKRDAALNRDLFRRYNISNDQAYDLLKENHQSKVRSTLGSTSVEHSYPATILQYPFYKVNLDLKTKRAFHRPALELKSQPGREFRFQKPRFVKKKNWRGREAKELYAKAEDLSLADNASLLLLEYSEEAPMMLSNFGMGSKLINFYRKKDADDQERPKRDIGETQVLLTQDKSPFSNFGYVDSGEVVPTIQNGLYRAPVFGHSALPTDFLIGISSTYENGDRLYIRNVENLHAVGQQFPSEEIPGQHSRKVTDAAKKRLRALAYRIYTKSLDRKDKVLDNATLLPHLPGHDMPQTRSKMREFMRYERSTKANAGDGTGAGVWVPMPGKQVPDAETIHSWLRPEAICVLDSMQAGVQHLADLGLSDSKGEEVKDVDEGANIELQLAPWRATKNFLNACQSKAMLQLHGEGDPTGRGAGFSFVKTSMKGGFTAVGESAEDKIDAKRRKENGGHSYNVAKQQKAYDDAIRRIWETQKASLSSREEDIEEDDADMDDGSHEPAPVSAHPYGRAATPRSSFGGPVVGRHRDDESVSQFSGFSAAREGRDAPTLTIQRKGGIDKFGQPLPDSMQVITDPRVIAIYNRKRAEISNQGSTKRAKPSKARAPNPLLLDMDMADFDMDLADMKPTGDAKQDALKVQRLEHELARVERNKERREAREKAKAKHRSSVAVGTTPSNLASPGPSEVDGTGGTGSPLNGGGGGGGGSTPAKSRGGRNKDGTARKCANCGQVGHIKTNRKLCPLLNGTRKLEEVGGGDSAFGASSAPLTL